MNLYERLFWYMISSISGFGWAVGLYLDSQILLRDGPLYATEVPAILVAGVYLFVNVVWLYPFLVREEYVAMPTVFTDHLRYCTPVGGTLAVVANVLVHLRTPVHGYIYASLVCAPLCMFSTLMLLRPVTTDFGLFYPPIILLLTITFRDYETYPWRWIVLVAAFVMIWARPVLEAWFAPDAADGAAAADGNAGDAAADGNAGDAAADGDEE